MIFKSYDEFQKLLKSRNFQKHIDNLSGKLKNKKILLYGAGILAEVIADNYDLSGLNITAVADSKYIYEKQDFKGFKTISPNEIKELAPDVILICAYNDIIIKDFFKKNYPEIINIQMTHIINKNLLEKIKIAIFGY